LAEDQPFGEPEPAPVVDPGAQPEAPESGPAAAAQGRARLAEDRLAEVLEAYRKLKTDNDAYRDRTTRNLERRFDQRRESLLLKFIDILDNMDRALEAAQTAYADQSLLVGLILVRTQLLQTLQDEGLERIPVLGLPFDPHVSEAVGTQSVSDPDQSGIVLKELMRGYRLNGRVARASRVILAEYGAAEAASPPEATEGAAPDNARAARSDPPASPEDVLQDDELTLEQIIARTEPEDPEDPKPGARRGR
jgi:molecular chaperone GrpE